MKQTLFYLFLLCQTMTLHAAATMEPDQTKTPFQNLMHYIETENKNAIFEITLKHPELINTESHYDGRFAAFDLPNLTVTPLVYAILQGKPLIVGLLLNLGANKNQKVNGYLPIESIENLVARSNEEKIRKMDEIGELFIKSTKYERDHFPAWEKAALKLKADRSWREQAIKDREKENAQPTPSAGVKRKRSNLVHTLSVHDLRQDLINKESATKKTKQDDEKNNSKQEEPTPLVVFFKAAASHSSIYSRKK